jgi:hypothetical protein
MRSVWSFWSKPFLAERHSSWASEFHHWLAWGLSVDTARAHYPKTSLVTDDEGARLLVDDLGLPFASVSLALNRLKKYDPEWWALGKIEAYRHQREPFVHIDSDVFLWRPLPDRVSGSPLFAQNPEPIVLGASCYRPEELERAIGSRGWLPEEWHWYRSAVKTPRAECCGIFGGSGVEFIRYYAGLALKTVTAPRNRGLARLPERIGHMILIEQYLLAACIEYHLVHAGSSFAPPSIEYMFDSIETAYSPAEAAALGYTHLAAGAKRNPRIARDLARRVAQDMPHYYERCARLWPLGTRLDH